MNETDLIDPPAAAVGELYDTGRFGTVRVVQRECPLCAANDPTPIPGHGEGIWRLVRCRVAR